MHEYADRVNEIIAYNEYIAENLEGMSEYSQYIADNIDQNIKYSQYIAEQLHSAGSYTLDTKAHDRKTKIEQLYG